MEDKELTYSERKIKEVFGDTENKRLKAIVSEAVEVQDGLLKGNTFNSDFPQSLLSLRNSFKNFDYNTGETAGKKKLIAENYF